jgi:altronate dehydratase
MKPTLLISERDNVATALEMLEPGRRLDVAGRTLTVVDRIPSGHKLAVARIAAGNEVIKYGSAIGTAIVDIEPGSHVHTHNLASKRGRGDLAVLPSGPESRLAEPADDRAATLPMDEGAGIARNDT